MIRGRFWTRRARPQRAIRTWAHSLAGNHRATCAKRSRVRALLQRGPGSAQEVSQLLDQVKPTLPVLLANLTSLGQILVTYNPSLEQLLVLLPAAIALSSRRTREEQPRGYPAQRFHRHCQRSARVHGWFPAALVVAFTGRHHHDRYAGRSLLQTAPRLPDLSTRGPQLSHAWDIPESGHPPSKSATTPSLISHWPCDNTTLGPYPLDPNLLSQGIPPR